MPDPLTWDTPSLTWDAGPSFTWDSQAPSPPTKSKAMSKIKAIVDFTAYSDTELGTLAQVVHDALAANAATFTAPPVTIVNFQTQITDYDTKLLAKASGAIADINAFEDARTLMEQTMAGYGNYVNIVANGNGTTVGLSGIPSYDTAHTPDTSPPAAPQNVRLTHGELSGTIIVRYKPEHSPSSNEIQIHLGDPNNEAGWVQKVLIKGGKAEIAGFAPGIVVWVRIRTMGLKGVMGAWSDPAQIRTL
jgi:hypothetical protein